MSKHLERDIELLERNVLAQSSMVEDMIRIATRCLCDQTTDGLHQLDQLEPQVNNREVRIEEECLKILALHQPVATDLRRVATVLKINTDLERIADLAVNIGERTYPLADSPVTPLPAGLDEMTTATIAMVRDAMDAFVELDADSARSVCQRDDIVDDLNHDIINELHKVMRCRPELVEPAVHLFSATRHIERIADHATNIAEDVIYLVEGEIARHYRKEPTA
jgi:phosphate transport system protein